MLPGTTPSFCNFREYHISSSALRNQFQCPSKCFKKERDMFLPRHKSTKILHFSHVFPLNFEVWNATDSGPIPGDKNYTKEQIVAKCPWPDDATQTIIIQIEHKELKEAENDLHSKHRSCLIDCASHDSFPLPTTYAIESTFLMDSYGKYMRMGVLYPLGFLESPETRLNNAPCCLLLFTYTYPTCVGIHISYMERLSIAFPSKWAVLIPTCPTEKRLVWRKGFV